MLPLVSWLRGVETISFHAPLKNLPVIERTVGELSHVIAGKQVEPVEPVEMTIDDL